MPAQPDLLVLKLMEKLSDCDPRIRRNATGALRMQGYKAAPALPAISRLIQDEDPWVRREAERTLEELRPLPTRG
jgi:HEAT repeat protein